MAAKHHIENGIIFVEYGTGLKVVGYSDLSDTRTRLTIPECLLIPCNGQLLKWYVSDIAKCAFENNKHIQVLELPKSLRYIDVGAFRNCTNLKTVIASFPTWTNASINIGKQAFSHCTKLEVVDLHRPIMWLTQEAFSFCPNLRQFKSPILDIAKHVFTPCKIEQLTFLDKCKIHGDSIEDSNVTEIVFQGDLGYMPQKTLRWLKKSNVKICCCFDSELQDLAYEGLPVEVVYPF